MSHYLQKLFCWPCLLLVTPSIYGLLKITAILKTYQELFKDIQPLKDYVHNHFSLNKLTNNVVTVLDTPMEHGKLF